MSNKMKIYIGLLVLGLAMIGGGLWFLFNPPAADNADSPVGCQWWAASINGSEVINHTIVSLYLRYDGSVQGSSGCNYYYGRYSVNATSINMSVGKTLMRCDEDILKQEDIYLDCLRVTTFYSVNGTLMEFYDASKHTLLVFERRPEYPMNPDDLIGTGWRLLSINGEQVTEEESGTLIFDEDGVSLHGLDRTSTYEYSYEAEGDTIVFTSISGGRIREPSGEFAHGQPSAIAYISPIVSYRLIDGQLEIYTERRITLVFKPYESP
jgi:heat shock protein HslJ